MEEIKTKFVAYVTEQLSAAPDGAAKTDLIEELSENLHQRWLDMTASGMSEDEAWQKAAEELGDTAELVDYLKSLQPDEPLPKMVLDPEKEDGGQLEDMMKNVEDIVRSAMSQAKNAIHEVKEQLSDAGVFRWSWKSDDGKAEVSIDAPEGSVVNIGVEEPDPAEEAFRTETAATLKAEIDAKEKAISAAEEELSDLEDRLSELEDELTELEDQLSDLEDDMDGSDQHMAAMERRIASKERQIERKQAQIDKTQEKIDAKEEEISELEDELDELQTELEELDDGEDDDNDEDDSRVGISINGINLNLDAVTKKLDDAAKKISSAFKDKPFTVGVDVDDSGCSIGVNPRTKSEKDVIYGVGYDKDKGGFFAQWGEYKGNYNRPVENGPVCSEALRGIAVQTVSGDVTIRMTEHPEDDVIIDGDVDKLDVRRSDDGVLTISQGKTASSSFFFGRGLSSASVTLYLPRRHWEFLRVSTISGDVRVEGDNEVDLLAVKTTSGELEGGLPRCGQLDFSSISGDLNWKGDVQTLRAKTTSGDVQLSGYLGETQISTTSGDIDLTGAVTALRCATTSGDIDVRSSVQPECLDVTSRSGDCALYLPDRGPFTVHFRTASGDLISDFFGSPMSGRDLTLSYDGEGGPVYELNTTSGDVRLKKL